MPELGCSVPTAIVFLPSEFQGILYDSLNRSLIFIFKVATSGGCWGGDRP
ncbi:MAG: hypothetical protein ACRC8Y_15775 [Chroococcales cyanobacterium]